MGQIDSASRLAGMQEYRAERGEPKYMPEKPYGRGFVAYGPWNYEYFVTKKNGKFYIDFVGNNTLRAVADKDNIHQRARDLLVSFLDHVRGVV